MSEDNGLPRGWARARVQKIMTLINGFPFKPSDWKPAGLPIIRIQNLNNPNAAFNYCPDARPEKFRVRAGDLLFAWSGTPGTSFGAHIWKGEDAWLNQHIFRVEFDRDAFDVRFLRLAINQNLTAYIRQAHGGAGLAHITKGRFEESELLIAPTNEQRRIVAKIEELFSNLDAGVAALERAKANLKRYRAAVLKAAVDGSLTAEWRAKHPNVEPATKLLERILVERRRKWEADQLAKFAAAGKQPPKNWKAKYIEPLPPDTSSLPELPEGWCWATTEQQNAAERPISYGVLQPGRDIDKGVPLIRVCDVADGKVAIEKLKRIDEAISNQFKRTIIQGGEVLLTVVGTIGRTAVAPAELAGANTARAVAVIATASSTNPHFLEMTLRESSMRAKLTLAAHEVARKTLNLEDVRTVAVPLAPLEEQQEILQQVAAALSQIDAAEQAVEHGLKRAARLRQSILKQAFEGKLVPQDPNDEPASDLLARLKVARHDRFASNGEMNGEDKRPKKARASKARS
ncbi:MAG TPA: restriction endonuclease subunit S [Pirellulales bacterium]|nr:restriction endonuclease subunit S [Pirellulales bacterium]